MTDEPTPPVAPPEKPRPTATLTPEQRSLAEAWLRTNWITANCPFHGPTTWLIGPTFVSSVAYFDPGGGTGIGGPSYPSFVVVCTICGYTVLVNAVLAKVITVTPPKPAADSVSVDAPGDLELS